MQTDPDTYKAEMIKMRQVLDDGGADLTRLRRSTIASLASRAGYDPEEGVPSF